jgi:hypothetical protein
LSGTAVAVEGAISISIIGQERAIHGKYDEARSFQLDATGVGVATTIQGDGKKPLAERIESLPVYPRDAREQTKAKSSFGGLIWGAHRAVGASAANRSGKVV